MNNYVEFFKQFRTQFKTTGAIAPSSRFLARALARPIELRRKPARILEVGPGTGPVTRRIVQLMKPDDHLDLVELNQSFVDILNEGFDKDSVHKQVAGQTEIHMCPIQEFANEEPFDFIVSGLPLNNFSPELVRDIFETMFKLLAPGGVLSYFEYMYVRPVRKRISQSAERQRMIQIDQIANEYLSKYRIRQDWVFANLPPAWAQHLHLPSPD